VGHLYIYKNRDAGTETCSPSVMRHAPADDKTIRSDKNNNFSVDKIGDRQEK
jgi:hypothetical protein